MSGHVTSQAAAGRERGVTHEALVRLQAGVGPDVSFEDSGRGETAAALHALVRTLSCVRPDVLFQMAGFLVCLIAELAFERPVCCHHIQVLLESQARGLGEDETEVGD